MPDHSPARAGRFVAPDSPILVTLRLSTPNSKPRRHHAPQSPALASLTWLNAVDRSRLPLLRSRVNSHFLSANPPVREPTWLCALMWDSVGGMWGFLEFGKFCEVDDEWVPCGRLPFAGGESRGISMAYPSPRDRWASPVIYPSAASSAPLLGTI